MIGFLSEATVLCSDNIECGWDQNGWAMMIFGGNSCTLSTSVLILAKQSIEASCLKYLFLFCSCVSSAQELNYWSAVRGVSDNGSQIINIFR